MRRLLHAVGAVVCAGLTVGSWAQAENTDDPVFWGLGTSAVVGLILSVFAIAGYDDD